MKPAPHKDKGQAAIVLADATLKRGARTLWEGLDVTIQPKEFVAVLGPNGSGKTSLLKVLLGLLPLTSGTVEIMGGAAHRGNKHIGYIPQLRDFDAELPIRGRDLVQLGAIGFRYGFGGMNKQLEQRIDKVIEDVGASEFADMPLGLLSGGEQQRLRVAQALVSQPDILLCDEPLLSLDIGSQRLITKLTDEYRKNTDVSIVFVTHEINPILQYVDKVIYLANGRWIVDKPEVVLQSETLSSLYGTPIDVVKLKDRVLVLGAEDEAMTAHDGHHGAER